ncbi:MAG: Ni/Fe hydrogenase subunit alpha [Bacteroidota bacterium]
MKTRTINVETLARVEGEGAVRIKLRGQSIQELVLNIYEPPRLFEGFLRGRRYLEVPDITARICGICPVAYQMSSVQAIERLLGVTVDPRVRDLRRLLYCGEWIESHALHIYLLHAPDFLGTQDAIQLAKVHPDIVKEGLRLKKIGNEIVRVVGGREIHPINVRVGGFYRSPDPSEFDALKKDLEWAIDASIRTIRWVATFPFPEFDRPYLFVALRHPEEYAITEGRIVASDGMDIDVSEFESNFIEEHVAHSNALHSVRKDGRSYFVGPLARFNLNFGMLTPLAREESEKAGLHGKCVNPFQSIIVRSVEMLYAFQEALRLVNAYQPPPFQEVTPRAGIGWGATEAPRGLLYHRYRIDERGSILDARIIPPTSQNQKSIEEDLREYVTKHHELPTDRLTLECEQAIRNYDPCISCATHFVSLEKVDEHLS